MDNVYIHILLVTLLVLNHVDFLIVVITKNRHLMFVINYYLVVFLMVHNVQIKGNVLSIKLKLLVNQEVMMVIQLNPVSSC
jgi:hypothetical protein